MSRLFAVLLLLLSLAGNAIGNNIAQSDANGRKPVRYMVFTLESREIALFMDKLVYMSKLPGSKTQGQVQDIMAASMQRNHHSFELNVEDANGQVIHHDAVELPALIRGEFHGKNGGIESYTVSPEEPAFVVRIPQIQGAKRLRMKSWLSSGRGPGAMALDAQKPLEAVFELDAHPGAMDVREAQAESELLPGKMTGDPGNRLNMLIKDDGYTQAERGKYASDTAELIQKFVNKQPFGEYEGYQNFFVQFTPSQESGSTHPPYKEGCMDNSCCGDAAAKYDSLGGQVRKTAFSCRYCGGNIQRMVVCDYAAVLADAAAVPDWDFIIVLMNDSTYGGSAGSFAVISTSPSMVDVSQHEYLHLFHSADEYAGINRGTCSDATPGGYPCPVNITDATQRQQIKWGYMIMPDTPLPTPETTAYDDLVGIFPFHDPVDLFRPFNHCIMRDLGHDPCPVCSQNYILKLYEGWKSGGKKIDPIEPGSENVPLGDVAISNPKTRFEVSLLKPQPPLKAVWLVDGVQTGTSGGGAFDYVPAKNGTASIQLKVNDPTPLVHPSMAGSLKSSRSWTATTSLSIGAPAQPSGPAAGLTEYSYAFSTSSSSQFPVEYRFDWGDGSFSAWSESATASKSWLAVGTYIVRAQSRFKDNQNFVSGWSSPLMVAITRISISLFSPPDSASYDSCTISSPPTFIWSVEGVFKGYELQFSADRISIPVKVKSLTSTNIPLNQDIWKSVFAMPGGSGGNVYWRVVGTKEDGGVLETGFRSILILAPQPVGSPAISLNKGTATLSWQASCNVKFKAWFGKDDKFSKSLTLEFSSSGGQFTSKLKASQWLKIRSLGLKARKVYWYVEAWDALGRRSQTQVMEFAF